MHVRLGMQNPIMEISLFKPNFTTANDSTVKSICIIIAPKEVLRVILVSIEEIITLDRKTNAHNPMPFIMGINVLFFTVITLLYSRWFPMC